jgi:hypothetical protein
MEMEQMKAHLLAEIKDDIKTNQGKADANLKEMKEEMRASQELLKDEMLAKMETNHEKVDAKI